MQLFFSKYIGPWVGPSERSLAMQLTTLGFVSVCVANKKRSLTTDRIIHALVTVISGLALDHHIRTLVRSKRMFSVAWHSQNKPLMFYSGVIVFFATHSIFVSLGFFFYSRLSKEGQEKWDGLIKKMNRLKSWLSIPYYCSQMFLTWQAHQALTHKSVEDLIPHIVNPTTKDPGAAAITVHLSSELLSNIQQSPDVDWSGIQTLINGDPHIRFLLLMASIAERIRVNIHPSIQRFKPLAVHIICTYAQLNAYRIERSILKSAFTTTT